LENYLHIYLVAQIWLNLPVDHGHFGYDIQLPLKKLSKKKKKKTLSSSSSSSSS
jgi:hypothetical protein